MATVELQVVTRVEKPDEFRHEPKLIMYCSGAAMPQGTLSASFSDKAGSEVKPHVTSAYPPVLGANEQPNGDAPPPSTCMVVHAESFHDVPTKWVELKEAIPYCTYGNTCPCKHIPVT